MLAGSPPFVADEAGETYARIAAGSFAPPPNFSRPARDLVARLFTVDVSARLGAGPGGAGEVRAHPFFRGVDWHALASRSVAPPIVPIPSDSSTSVYFDDYSALPPLHAGEALTNADQALFEGI